MEDFLQGSELVIARVEHRGLFQNRLKVLVHSSWESTEGYLLVVRPMGRRFARQLHLTDQGILVGLPYQNQAFLAYDTIKAKGYSELANEKSNEPGQPAGTMKELSPFLLIGPHDTPSTDDVDSVMNADLYSIPDLQVVKRDFINPNPNIRDFAKTLYFNPSKK